MGWDNPLSTFFAEVFRVRGERRTSVLWLGSVPRQVRQPEELVKPLAPFADLDTVTLGCLRRDAAEACGRGPTPLQRSALDVFSR